MPPHFITCQLRGWILVGIVGLALSAARVEAQTILVNGTNYSGGPNSISGDIQLNANTTVTFSGGTTFSGANATLVGSSSWIYWQQVATLTGKAISFGPSSGLYVTGVNNSLTLDAASTGTGTLNIYSDGSAGATFVNQGTLTHTGGSGSIYAANFTNSGSITANAGTLYLGYPSAAYTALNTGTVTADGSGTTVYIRGLFDNNGTLTAQNSGMLFFDGTNTSANLGNVVLTSGGRARLNGTIDNTASTLTAPTGGTFELYGGTISGGTIAAGALSFTTSAGFLTGTTLLGDLNLPVTSSYVYLNGGSTFTGANLTLTNSAFIYWQQVGTLAGKTITQAQSSGLYVTGVNNALTLDSASTVTGVLNIYSDGNAGTGFTNQGTMTHTGGSGAVYAALFTNSGTITANAGTLYLGYPSAAYAALNTGTVTADGSGTTVYIRGSFDNNGTLAAQNSGILFFDGTNTSANLGSVVLSSGGRARLNGTIDNTSSTLTAPTGGAFDLYGGTISGGTIAAGAVNFTTSAGYLSGTTLLGDLNLPVISSYVYLNGGSTFTGSNLTLANSTFIYWQQVGTLAGKTITQATSSGLYITGANNALTLDSASTVTGAVNIYSDGSAGTGFTNQGTLNHTGGTGSIYAALFTNTGTITANAGTLYLGYPSVGYNTTNTGTVTADGSGTMVYIRGNFDNNGTLTAQNSAVLRFDGANTTANLGAVTLSGGGRAQLNGTIDNTATTLTAPSGGSFDLFGGTISGGSIAVGALSLTTSGGYLSGVTWLGDLNLTNVSSYAYFNGGSTFTGANLSLTNSAFIYWQQVGTLAGKTMTQATSSGFYITGVNNALTFDSATTLTGVLNIYADGSAGTAFTNQGALTHTGGTGSIYATSFTNTGTILANAGTLSLGYPSVGYNVTNTGTVTADGSGTMVYIRGNFDNNGTLTAQNSAVFRYDGTNTTANLGTVVLASGGHAQFNGTIDNTAATLTAPTGGTYDLLGGTISGGSIATGALTFTSSGGTLNGATLLGDLSLAASATVYFAGGATFTGANATFANSSGVYWQQVGTLSAKTLNLGSGAYLYVSGANHTLTLDAATTLVGTANVYTDGSVGTAVTNQGTITHNSGTGSVYAPTFTNSGTITATAGSLYVGSSSVGYNFFNTGSVTADGSSTYAYLGGNFVNTGTLYAQNSGRLYFTGANITANLGLIQLSTGGRALLGGTLDNTAATLNAIIGGTFELSSGTINNGTIAPGALAFTTSGGTLSGVTISGDLSLATNGATAYFTNGTTFTGANGTLASNSGIYWQQVGTLTGKTMTFGANAYLYVSAANSALTLDPTTTVTGSANIYSDGSVGTAITNQGSITNTVGTGSLYARTFTNSGTITGTAGTLYLGYNSAGYNFANTASGTIVVNGANTYLQNPLSNAGTINVQSGTLYASTNLTNTTGVIQGAGTINGSLVMAGGTLNPGNSIGTLTFQSSNFSVTGASTLNIEIGGATSDQIVFQTPLSNVDIGAGLVTLSIQLLSAPTAGTTYTILSIPSGPQTFTGTFAGLPTTGSSLIATFGVQSYVFSVSYLPTSVKLDFVPVPEPSTYVLLGSGLALLALGARRRQRRA